MSEDAIDTANFASSNLRSGTWDPSTCEMVIEFARTGAQYRWTDVSQDDWLGLKHAFSPGNYLATNFPPGEPV